MKRYIKVYLKLLSMSWSTNMVYRVNFFLWAFIHSFTAVISIIFFKTVFGFISDINGWSYYEILILVGTRKLFTGIGSLTVIPMIYGLTGYIKNGKLEGLLAKPIDTIFMAAFRWLDVEDVGNIFIGLGIIIFSAREGGIYLGFGNIILFSILLILGLIILHSVIVIIFSFALRLIFVESLNNLVWTFLNISDRPVTIYKGGMYIFLVFILPIAMMVFVPVQALINKVDWVLVGYSIVFTIITFFSSRFLFYRSLRNFSGVSS